MKTIPTPTYEVFVGESLPDLKLFVRDNTQLVTGLGSGHTFALKVATLAGEVLFTKTTGIIGQTGSGFQPLGTPNVIVAWAVADELDQLEAGATYRAQLFTTRAVDSKKSVDEFLISARATL